MMEQRALGPFQVGAIGVGCMNLSHAYGRPPAPEGAARLLLRAIDLGVTHFDTAALYGFGANETLVGRVLAPLRQRITWASKCGMQGVAGPDRVKRRVIDGRPETLRQTCEDALRRLRTDVIDLYYLHCWDKSVPIEDSVGALARLVEEGKIRASGLSEVSGATLRRAHTVHPIAAVQSEYSLWTRHPELGVQEACREIGAAFVAFSPLGRGFLAGALPDTGAMAALPSTTCATPCRASRERIWRRISAGCRITWRSRRKPAARRRSWRSPGCYRRRRISCRFRARP